MSLKSGLGSRDSGWSPRHAFQPPMLESQADRSTTLGLSASGSLRVPHIQDTMNLLKLQLSGRTERSGGNEVLTEVILPTRSIKLARLSARRITD